VDRLATAAMLFGMAPMAVERCRVLELGCGDGTNLLGMALGLPGSEFVGVDLSNRHIAEGARKLRRFRCRNLRLVNDDLANVGGEYGTFDYVIAHGVYSWVAPPDAAALLRVCRSRLNAQGVAYVSYNTYPGWHLLRAARDLMRFHTADVTDPHERARMAVEVVAKYLAMIPEDSAAAIPFAAYRDLTRRREGSVEEVDAALLYDELNAWNEPHYFAEFATAAHEAGLQFLAEADFANLTSRSVDPALAEFAQAHARSLIDLEQYLDFATNRTFRRTLLCHRGLELRRSVSPDAAYLASFYVSSAATPADEAGSVPVRRFEAPDGTAFATDDQLVAATLLRLGEAYPARIPFSALAEMASRTTDADRLASNLVAAFAASRGLVGLHSYSPTVVGEPSKRPRASRLARAQALTTGVVTNVLYERVRVPEGPRRLLPLLNGRRELAELETMSAAGRETTVRAGDGTALQDLRWLAAAGFLEA
jgi:SAM-dependent methyltransferase